MNKKIFANRIADMNAMYGLDMTEVPYLWSNFNERLDKFKKILLDEVNEIDDIKKPWVVVNDVDCLVAIADLLGDITVYCRSEAMKYGIPLEQVLDIIMDSNESKLGADGEPIIDENGKFLKGPNYWKPEPKIKKLLTKIIDGNKAF